MASERQVEEATPGPKQHPAITHCDNCGCDWLDNGLNPVGCPYCKQTDEHVRKGDPDMIQELIRQRDEMAKALEPFAAVAECDIGDDETDSDIFLPISRRNARAKPITVGDMRKALAALSSDLKGGQYE